MQKLGETRTSYQRDHALLTPDSFVRAPMPGMKGATAIVHAAPATGAGFTQYTAEFEARGALGPTAAQRFVYVLDGVVTVEFSGKKRRFEKTSQPLRGVKPPRALFGDERAIAGKPLMGDDALEVRTLIPADPAFDLA